MSVISLSHHVNICPPAMSERIGVFLCVSQFSNFYLTVVRRIILQLGSNLFEERYVIKFSVASYVFPHIFSCFMSSGNRYVSEIGSTIHLLYTNYVLVQSVLYA